MQCDPELLLASDRASNDEFGSAIDVDGAIAVIGAPENDEAAFNAGAAYVYEFDGQAWMERQKLLASDAHENLQFGFSVSVHGDLILVGAFGYGEGAQSSRGAVYVFRRNGEVWVEQETIVAGDWARWAQFGQSIAFDGEWLLVGAPQDDDRGEFAGSAYLYRYTDGNWLLQQKLLADDGTDLDQFGRDVDLAGDALALSAIGDDDLGDRSGAVYVFRYDGDSWTQEAKLLANDGAAGAVFGRSISIDDQTIAIGASDDEAGASAGAVYVFSHDGNQWNQVSKLFASDAQEGAVFGSAVDLVGTQLLIGAERFDQEGFGDGKAYLFEFDQKWMETKSFLPDVDDRTRQFGDPVLLSNGLAFIGDEEYNDNWSTGAAYVFDVSCPGGNADLLDLDVTTGAILDGGVDDLRNSDDSYLHTRSGFGQTFIDLHNMTMVVNASTTVDSPATLDLTIESRIDEPAGTARVSLRNWNTGEFEPVDTFPVGATNYVNTSGGGEIDLQLRHVVFVPFLAFTFESFVDHVEIAVE